MLVCMKQLNRLRENKGNVVLVKASITGKYQNRNTFFYDINHQVMN